MEGEESLLELEKSVQARLQLTRHERQHIKECIESLDNKIKTLIGSTKGRPRETDQQLVDNIRMIEYTHATTPQTNVDERQFMRELDRLKKKRKDLAENIEKQTSIDELKLKRSALQKELKEKEICLDELYQGARRIRVALKLNYEPNMLVEESIVIPESKLPQVIGRGGSGVKSIEAECNVGIDSDKVGGTTRLRVVGLPSGLTLAMERIRGVLATETEEVTLSDMVLVCLLKDKAALVMDIQQRCDVHVDVSRANKTCRVTGLAANTAAALAEIAALDCCKRQVKVDASVLPFVFGKGGAMIRSIQEEHGVVVEVDRDKLQVEVIGTRAGVEGAAQALALLTEEHLEVEVRVECERHVLLEAIVGPKGATIRQLQKDLNVGLTMEREGAEAAGAAGGREVLVVKGNAVRTAAAKQHIQDLIERFEAGVEIVDIPADCVPILLGKKGSRISALREEHPNVTIDIATATNTLRLHSDNVVDRAAARSAIQCIVDDNMTAEFAISKDAAISLKGSKGAETRTFLQEQLLLNVDIQPDSEIIKFRGRGSNFTRGIETVNQFCEDHYTLENTYSSEDVQCLLSGGKDDNVIKQVEKECGVEVYFNRAKSTVRIVGNRQAVNNADDCLNKILQGESSGSSVVPMHDEALGALIGKGGARIRDFESTHSVKVDLLRSRNQVRVRGEPVAVEAAVVALMRFLDKHRTNGTISVSGVNSEVPITKALLEDICGKVFFLYGADSSIQNQDTIVFQGTLRQVEEAKKYALEVLSDQSKTHIPLRPHHAQYLVDSEEAKRKLQQSALSAGATACITPESSTISLTGPCACMTKARLNVYRLLDFLFPLEFSSVVADPLTLQYLWNDSVGRHALMRLFPDATVEFDFVMSCIRVVVEESSLLHVVVEHVRQMVADVKRRVCSLELSMQEMEALQSRKAVLQRVEKESGAAIHLPKRDQMGVTILGSDESAVETAKTALLEAIQTILRENWTVKLTGDVIGSLIGKQGANVKKLRAETKANIDIDARTGVVKVSGKEDHVNEAKRRIVEFVEEKEMENHVMKILVTPKCFGTIIGPKGATIREIKAASGVTFIDVDRQSNHVVLRGRYVKL